MKISISQKDNGIVLRAVNVQGSEIQRTEIPLSKLEAHELVTELLKHREFLSNWENGFN